MNADEVKAGKIYHTEMTFGFLSVVVPVYVTELVSEESGRRSWRGVRMDNNSPVSVNTAQAFQCEAVRDGVEWRRLDPSGVAQLYHRIYLAHGADPKNAAKYLEMIGAHRVNQETFQEAQTITESHAAEVFDYLSVHFPQLTGTRKRRLAGSGTWSYWRNILHAVSLAWRAKRLLMEHFTAAWGEAQEDIFQFARKLHGNPESAVQKASGVFQAAAREAVSSAALRDLATGSPAALCDRLANNTAGINRVTANDAVFAQHYRSCRTVERMRARQTIHTICGVVGGVS